MNKRHSLSADNLFLGRSIKTSITEECEESSIKQPIDYKNELTFYFYNAMLQNIVKDWQITVNDTADSIASGDEVISISNKPYEPCSGTSMEEEEMKSDTPPIASFHKRSRRSHSIFNRMSKRRSDGGVSTTNLKQRIGLQRRSMARLKIRKSHSKQYSFSTNIHEQIVKDESKDAWILKTEMETAEVNFCNGNKYIGELYQKKMHGTGQFIWSDGTKYIGDFKNGEMTGKGRIEFQDKSVYEGEVYKGYIHGYGNEYKSYKDSFYNGEYFLSSKHGNGRMMFGLNNYYEGPWNMNKREGKGLRHYKNGTKYYGECVNGKRHGFGSATLKNSDYYCGEWNNGEKHGYGEYVWDAFLNNHLCIPVQNKYCGIWDHDSMHGFGLLYFGVEGGARYAGTFYRNIKHGAGIIVCNDGKVIKADPLFVNDKAVCIKAGKITKSHSSSIISSSYESNILETEKSINNCTNLTCTNLDPRIYPIMPQHVLRQQNFADIKNFVFPCYGFEKSTIARINQYKLIYPNDLHLECVSMTIDLSSSELIDLSKIINKVAAKYLYVIKNTNNKENMSSIKKRYFKELKVWPCLLSQYFCEDYVFDRFNKYKECDNFVLVEEHRARKAIRKNLSYLVDLYNYYAFVACIPNRPKYKPWLMRICLWQLFMDCKMPHKKITLNQIDEMLAEYSTVAVADIHNPFDVIYFWEYLTCLLALAWRLYGDDFINIETSGILEKAFNKFLATDIFPNAKQHIGCALFEFRDVIPITAAYEWYKSFGPDFTVYNFLQSSSSLYRIPPPGYFQDIGVKIPEIQHGENVAFVSDKILYREVLSYVIGNKKYNFPIVYAHKHGFYLKSLKYLFLLGGRRVLTILRDICPMVTKDDEYINMNHSLSFLEFYEALLKCTQEKIYEDIRVERHNSVDVGKRRTICTTTSIKPKKDKKNSRFKATFV